MSWRQGPDEAAGVGAREPHHGVGDVAAEWGAVAVAAEGQGRMTEGDRLHRLGQPAGEADRLRGADLIADKDEPVPAQRFDLATARSSTAGMLEPGRLLADPGDVEARDVGPLLKAGLIRVHSTSVTEGTNSSARTVHGPIKPRKRAPVRGPFGSERTCRQEICFLARRSFKS